MTSFPIIRRYPLILVLGFCLAACGGRTGETGYTETTIEGVTVRTCLDPAPPRVDPYLVTSAAIIGSDQSEDTYLLAGANFLGLSRSGLLVVSDSRSGRFHLFTPDGVHRGSFGRSGQGPGEFSPMARFLFDGEAIHIFDRGLRRRTLLDLDGSIRSLTRYPEEFTDLGATHPAAFLGPWENRSYLCELKQRSSRTNTFTFRIAVRDTALHETATLIDTVYSPGVVIVGVDSRHHPFVLGWPASAVANDLPVAWSWGREFRIDFIDLTDQSRRAVIIPHQALPVTPEHREDYLSRYYEREGLIEEARRKLPWPDLFPHLEYMTWDTAGRLWVLEYRDPLREDAPWIYQVFARYGAWLFRQELPVRAGDMQEGGMYVSEVDDEIGPVIRFYRFEER